MAAWWEDKPKAELSQGDVVLNQPVTAPVEPLRYLWKGSLKGGLAGWGEDSNPKPDNNGMSHVLHKGRAAPVVVLSHDCDIDKPKRTTRVIVAPLRSTGELTPDERASVGAPGKYHSMLLPDVPELGECYFDLRLSTFLTLPLIQSGQRVASMNDAGAQRLRAQIVAFYTRLRLEDIKGV